MKMIVCAKYIGTMEWKVLKSGEQYARDLIHGYFFSEQNNAKNDDRDEYATTTHSDHEPFSMCNSWKLLNKLIKLLKIWECSIVVLCVYILLFCTYIDISSIANSHTNKMRQRTRQGREYGKEEEREREEEKKKKNQEHMRQFYLQLLQYTSTSLWSEIKQKKTPDECIQTIALKRKFEEFMSVTVCVRFYLAARETQYPSWGYKRTE